MHYRITNAVAIIYALRIRLFFLVVTTQHQYYYESLVSKSIDIRERLVIDLEKCHGQRGQREDIEQDKWAC